MAYVLVVDDDADIRGIIAACLTEAGFPVRQATDGVQALASIAAAVPTMVLLDLNMPVMTGWNVFSTLHEIAVTVPVVVMTARQDAAAQAQAYAADGYLAKPFDLNELVNQVQRFYPTAVS